MINYDRKGFTLIEILIVVAIIAILASIVLVGLGPTQQAGRDARRLSDLHEVQNGLELYYNSCGYYPGTATAAPCTAYAAIGKSGSPSTAYNTLATELVAFTALGIGSVPNDPTSGRSYTYSVVPGGTAYVLGATLENKTNSVFNSYTVPTTITGATDGDGAGVCVQASGQYCISI